MKTLEGLTQNRILCARNYSNSDGILEKPSISVISWILGVFLFFQFVQRYYGCETYAHDA